MTHRDDLFGPRYHLEFGDALSVMRTLPDTSVNCIVTSPPYFGLRDYGHNGQLGQESTPQEYVLKLVEIFREARRVLRDDGTLWLNLGDSYAGSWGARGRGGNTNSPRPDLEEKHGTQAPNRNGYSPWGVKPKDLIGIPWRVAFALQDDGWYLRQDIIWHKPNPMPESVRDRCTKAHEYLFMLSKSPRYYFDADAIKEPMSVSSVSRLSQPNLKNQNGSDRVPGKTNGNMKAVGKIRGHSRRHAGFNDRWDVMTKAEQCSGYRNKRSVWSVATRPYKGPHFATFPPALVEPCILAGSPRGGVVLDPFAGSGTTGAVALSHRRQAVLIELNPDYGPLILERLALDDDRTPPRRGKP